MNKDVFTAVCDALTTGVSELRWIDYDAGQIDNQSERPAIAFPACLVDVSYTGCEDQDNSAGQMCDTQVILRFAFQPTGATNANSPVRVQGLANFATMQKAHEALQSHYIIKKSAPFSRLSATPERRTDGIRVYRVVYRTVVYDM